MRRDNADMTQDLEARGLEVLKHAVDAQRKGLKVYESLRNLNEVIGTEYGDRVLYELIQNAHDAHQPNNDEGRIAIRLVVRSETDGTLYVANGGGGFRPEDAEAIMNLAVSAKGVGEGIGNKGLGFRSVEALTDDVRIFSRSGRNKTKRFDGYCFRFAREGEIEGILRSDGVDVDTSKEVAKKVPRYLVPLLLNEQPEDVSRYARDGYATVIVVPMSTAEAVDLAKRQVKALADLDAPILLFLDRIAEFHIDVKTPDESSSYRRRLYRRETAIGDIPNLTGCRMHEVRVGGDRRFLVVRREVDKERVLDAVKRSISRAPQIKRWLEWKGQPVVSVAVGLSAGAAAKGRFYNFLPMGEEAESPLMGYLDAPFFADIDRRDADFDLPLNETLIQAAAKACVATALSIVDQDRDIPQRAVFDLIAWTDEHAKKLGDALKGMGTSLHSARVIPTISVDEKIALPKETVNAFIKADLVREYDPVEALAGLESALGNQVTENRRKEALLWAFEVWRTAGAGVEQALQSAELYVPTLSGWQPATKVVFSSSWTPLGTTLENFLAETMGVSPDCQRAWGLLLVCLGDWPVSTRDNKRRWVDFLTVLGVADGLRPVAASIQYSGGGSSWNNLLHSGKAKEGLDQGWCIEVSLSQFAHPYTEYRRRGEAWRLPGQIEHGNLPDTAKEAFSELAFKHLEAQGDKFLTFKVGRFERAQRAWDHRVLPTPLATFLRSKAWVGAHTQEGPDFRKANECWAARTMREKPPRFVDRTSDTVVGLVVGNQDFADLVFGSKLGLRDWRDKDTAVERLGELAAVAAGLASHDRRDFRREYRRAWLEVVETDVSLPEHLSLAVYRSGRLETLNGSAAAPTVIVTQKAQQREARVLSSAGWALLDVGDDTATEKAAELLAATGMFKPRQLDRVQLLVDGETFVPRSSDPPLTSLELSWLPEVVVLGHELLGEQLERGVLRDTVDRRIREIRVRHCKKITLVVDGEKVSSNEMTLYAFEHEELPTLILSDRLQLNWGTLVVSARQKIP